MAYKKIVKEFKEFAGESFSQSIQKDNGETWKSTEVATYEMLDINGPVAGVTGDLLKSDDNKSIGFMIPKTSTVGLVGKHKVIVSLGSTENANISDVVAEYNIEYKERKAD